jgi:hypothetical protein
VWPMRESHRVGHGEQRQQAAGGRTHLDPCVREVLLDRN